MHIYHTGQDYSTGNNESAKKRYSGKTNKGNTYVTNNIDSIVAHSSRKNEKHIYIQLQYP